jgi:hypothetical protein
VEIVWLTNAGRPDSIRPTDLPAIEDRVTRAVAERGVTAVYFGGIEYLISIHGLDRIVALLNGIQAAATKAGARVTVPVEPTLVMPAAMERLRSEFPSVPPG